MIINGEVGDKLMLEGKYVRAVKNYQCLAEYFCYQLFIFFFFDVFAGSGSLPFLTFPDIIAPGEDDSGKKK